MAEPVALLTVTDATILAMLADQQFLAIAPCLSGISRSYTQGKPSCGRCAAKKQALVRNTMNEAKNCIASLGSNARNSLKQLLNAKQLQVIKYNHKGHKVVVRL